MPNQTIHKTLRTRSALFGLREEMIQTAIASSPYGEELRYLYATMPLSDAANYPPELFEGFAAQGRWLRENVAWCAALPEQLYREQVLYHRINDEELSDCRKIFCEALLPLIQDMTMEEAALAVNYWCMEQATYRLTDERTVSPLTMLRCSFGRCGEESTFTATALRSVGIPARQVYAPKWPHCDDNHAWVEVCIDGVWRYLGACEPEESLDRGWFSAAASRAMLVHSRTFGESASSEEFISKEGCMSLWNQLSRYADKAELSITVTEEGRPLPDVSLSLELLNYAQFSPIAALRTDEQGRAKLTTGLGDLHIHCEKEGRFLRRLVDLRKETSVEIDFGAARTAEEACSGIDFNMEPPKDNMRFLKAQSEAVKLRRQEKFDAALARRQAKEQRTWLSCEAALEKAAALGYEPAERAAALLSKTYGNEEELLCFLAPPENRPLRLALLESLREKDLYDCKADILEGHLAAALPYEKDYPTERFVEELLCPRIGLEPLTNWRRTADEFSPEEQAAFRKDPLELGSWLRAHIAHYPEEDSAVLLTCPAGAMATGCGSERSRDILFVALCRCLGIAARLAPDDGRPQFWDGSAYRDGLPEQELPRRPFTLISGEREPWLYGQTWSLARLEKGRYKTLDLSRERWQEGSLTLSLLEGSYRLLTCKRMPTGAIFAREYRFTHGEGEGSSLAISLRNSRLTDLLSDKPIPDFQLYEADGSPVSMARACGEGASLLLWLEEGKEPTEHILNELHDLRDSFAKLTANIFFIVKSESSLKDPRMARALAELPRIRVLYDDFRDTMFLLARRMYIDPDKLPIAVLCRQGLTAIYGSSGYNVGSADLLLKIFGEL